MGPMGVFKLAVFLLLFPILLYLSWASWRQRGSHGYYRFFAWVSILGLFLLNVAHWFQDPFSPLQWGSWLLLVLSASLAVHAFWILRKYGRQGAERMEEHLLEVEKTTTLVTQGIYRYVRHPLYSSLLSLAWGIFCKDPSGLAGVLSVVATSFVLTTARADEQECLVYFGADYRRHMQRTKMFIPFLL